MKNIIILSLIGLIISKKNVNAQHIMGKVGLKNKNGTVEYVQGITVSSLDKKRGTATDNTGQYHLNLVATDSKVIFSFIGYLTDTLLVGKDNFKLIILEENTAELSEVIIRKDILSLDRLNPINTEILTEATLKKAACCNLSESFETNATVSVNYTDAITGSKQIQMLGLAGNYVQINTDNIPTIRGLNTSYGLNFVPGTWIKSIDIGKGVGSVVNGYESISGIINVELQPTENDDKLFINSYLNNLGRAELNAHSSYKLGKNWNGLVLGHVSGLGKEVNKNADKFLDTPIYQQVNLMKRFQYKTDKKQAIIGLKYVYDNKYSGEEGFEPKGNNLKYGFTSKTKRYEINGKYAWLYPNKPFQGLGLIVNSLWHNNESSFGFKKYRGQEKSVYGNLIYQNIIGTSFHTYKIGASFLWDNFDEHYTNIHLKRNEIVPGIFAEYSFNNGGKWLVLVGNRIDFPNLYGTKYTPRLHFKREFEGNWHVRGTLGTGWRVPNVFAENFGNFVNSRNLTIKETIKPEEAVNYGLNIAKSFEILKRKAGITLDYYQTNFKNQWIVDMESSGKIDMYNLPGKSFSKSFQVEWVYNPAKRWETKLAYRFFDVQSSVRSTKGDVYRMAKQFISQDRVIFNTSYATKWDKWKIDFTWQWNGPSRIPDYSNNHVHDVTSKPIYSPKYSVINGQVSKVYKNWEFYIGGENLGNFKQQKVIHDAANPFGANFDASMVWGPVVGRIVYSGIRYTIPK